MKDMRLAVIVLGIRVKQESDGMIFTYSISLRERKSYNGKSRRIKRTHAWQLLSNGVIALDYIRSKEKLVDPLTKGLPKKQVVFISRGMGLKPTQWVITWWKPNLATLEIPWLGSIGKLVEEHSRSFIHFSFLWNNNVYPLINKSWIIYF